MKKYIISALIYLMLFSVVNGLTGMLFRGDSFMYGFLPASPLRWILRIGFVSYATIYGPIKFKNL